MPLFRVKKVWDYCTYNKLFFLLIVILFLSLSFLIDWTGKANRYYIIIYSIYSIAVMGYGMSITRDRMYEGFRLPKIFVKDIIIMGVKAWIVLAVYLAVQGFILDLICSPLNFPPFNLEEMLFEFPKTISMLFKHDAISSIIFLVAGGILFYISVFFMEIALARLADSGSFWSSFSLATIKRTIDKIGWREYTIDYTLIVITIVFFLFLKHLPISNVYLLHVWRLILNLFIFATEFLGIGAIYSILKQKELNGSEE